MSSGSGCSPSLLWYLPLSPRPGWSGLDVDLIGLRQTQRQLVAMDLHLHGVSHGGQLYHRYLCAGDHAHIQKVLPQRTLAAHPANHGAFACL